MAQSNPIDDIIRLVDKVHNVINNTADPKALERTRQDLATAHRDLVNEVVGGTIDLGDSSNDLEKVLPLYFRMDALTKFLLLQKP